MELIPLVFVVMLLAAGWGPYLMVLAVLMSGFGVMLYVATRVVVAGVSHGQRNR